ncbi:MAG: long-chain fatty acid--CoA ligase [Pseudomonadota bacterium]
MLRGQMMDTPLMISGILAHAAQAHGEQEIVTRTVEGPIHRYTYRDCYARTQQLAHALIALGVEPGDRIATFAWNTYRHVELYYGISGIGAVCHTVNPRLFHDQLEYIVNHAEDRFIFVDLNLVELLEGLADKFPKVEGYVVMTDREHMPETSLKNAMCYEDLLEGQPESYDWPLFDENTAAAMCYTSGTTGNPKGALYSHRSTVLHAMGLLAAGTLTMDSATCVLPVVPMFHVQAWGQAYAAPICGAKMVMPGFRLDPASLVELFDSENVNLTLGVPTIWLGLLNHLNETGTKLPPGFVLVSGGAAAPLSMIKAYEEDHGITYVQGWGMTETSPVCAAGGEGPGFAELGEDTRYARKMKQRRLFGVELRILDDDHKDVAHDGESSGELVCRGPWIASGYYNDDEASKAAITEDGWFRTGDVATIDDESLLQITDRTKDLIKSGGEWISSIDLESAVMGHPDVEEAAAIAMPHPKWTERPMLVIVSRDGSNLTADGVRAHLDGQVAKWWMPDDIAFVDELPHTATGKVSKLQLRERFKDHKLPTI